MSKFLPTPVDLQALPPRVIVAFAVRCVRRIQPLYDLPHDQQHPASLEPPLCAAEAFARGDGPSSDAIRLAVALSHAANAAHYSAHAWSCMEPWQHHHRDDPSAKAAATYAENEARDYRRQAAEAAEAANRVLTDTKVDGNLAQLAAQIARTATHVGASHVAFKARAAIAADFQCIRELTAAADEPLDSGESGALGLLWPAGEPLWTGVKQ